jgi:RimJ/RimL family protein N-acetyltransferase
MRWPAAEPIGSTRLTLEPLSVGHAAEMVGVLADRELYTYTGGSPPDALELARRYAAQVEGPPEDGSEWWLNWVIRHRTSREAVGYVQATVEEQEGGRSAQVAWVVGVRSQGQGIATESGRAMLGWLRGQGVSRVTALIHPGHVRSGRVAAALGFTPTAEVVDGETCWTAQ